MTEGIVVLSCFDGMACGLEALKRAGIKVKAYYASEIDKPAMTVAKKNHPEIIHLGDIQEWRSWDIPRPDLIIGGSPCQGFSFAGKQLNFDDPRSKLFFTFYDILELYDWPDYILENVKMARKSEAAITKLMGVEPHFVNSGIVSAQNRQRLYWYSWEAPEPKDRGVVLSDIIEYGYVDRDKAYCIDANYWKGGNHKSYFEKRRRQLVFDDDTLQEYRKLTPLECERLQTLPEGYTDGVSNTQRYKMLGNGWTVDVIVHILLHSRLCGR